MTTNQTEKPGEETRKRFNLKKYVSPVFLALLAVAFIMWYLTKLSYSYTSQIPVLVNIEGQKFRVSCVAKGVGYRILSHRVFNKSRVNLNFSDIQMTPSEVNPNSYVINPYSLENAIQMRNSDISIVSIGEIPEIIYTPR